MYIHVLQYPIYNLPLNNISFILGLIVMQKKL